MADDEYITSDLFGYVADNDDEPAIGNGTDLRGRYAEFLVCANLTKLGYYVVHVDAAGFDLLLDYEEQTYRIEVKSGSRSHEGPFKQRMEWRVARRGREGSENHVRYRRRRPITPADTDLLALYCRVYETTVFYPVLGPINAVRLPTSFVRNSAEGQKSLSSAIAKLQRFRDMSVAGARSRIAP
jgi:hypothetical protein